MPLRSSSGRFQDFGLPQAIRTDNGVPFASAHALYGLSKLAVWWLRLGIGLERITPGHPEQNGRHDRLHLTLKTEATQVDEHIWLVTFMHYDLGYFDDETCRLEPIENPFGPNLLPMSPE